MKKFKKYNIKNILSGSEGVELNEAKPFDEAERERAISELMDQILSSDLFQETFEKLSKTITMLLPYNGKDSFYLYSPTLQSFNYIKAPIEAVVIEESNGRETMCLIHNVPYMVPDKYLKDVGYN